MKRFKLLTLLGIRPDYIRMYKLIRLLDESKDEVEHILVHSGQHYDPELFGNFLKEFNIRKPDHDLGIGLALKERGASNHAYQVALLNERLYDLIQELKPDAVMYLGDTNTVLSAVTVARCGIPVIHLEAGGRSYDWRMPEEKNRLVIDHLSDALYSYLPRYKELLVAEGIDGFRVTVIGNIIVDAINDFMPQVDASSVLRELGVSEKNFILVTLHREENINTKEILENKLSDILKFATEKNLPVVWPVMPRTQSAIENFGLQGITDDPAFVKTAPLGFFDFLRLEKSARLVVSDSGTVQEETLVLGTPCVIARRSTERPETIWIGATILEGQEGPGALYAKMAEAFNMLTNWDRTILNPMGGSPSERAFADLINKIQSGYFKTSRDLEAIQNDPRVRQAYNLPT
ncbi:UDP-N-acetylglucosamine 2-epimerase [candidate division Kazan bacterium RBG_13_50_9]|uniref:UDP-N-acetylglucosamine 2-epimerase n=1 Tax=candidate division Kazan bacterium RBG_13_50_9 TaxID=1798535 RepID=A0A1F4NRZ2_UNCK3|nr:MAG: UDP-N-acetylglucosamine 2-epimerase [candidate division Kazan bacterium RBG_13_50_9]